MQHCTSYFDFSLLVCIIDSYNFSCYTWYCVIYALTIGLGFMHLVTWGDRGPHYMKYVTNCSGLHLIQQNIKIGESIN